MTGGDKTGEVRDSHTFKRREIDWAVSFYAMNAGKVSKGHLSATDS